MHACAHTHTHSHTVMRQDLSQLMSPLKINRQLQWGISGLSTFIFNNNYQVIIFDINCRNLNR